MANKFVGFYMDNDFKGRFRVSSIIKETGATYTLLDDNDDSPYNFEVKTKKSEIKLDNMLLHDVSYSDGYPSGVVFNTVMDESLITEDFIAETFSTMQKIIVDAYQEHVQFIQKKLEALSK